MQTIDDFIHVVDDVLTEETCVDVINSFEYADKCGQSYRRSKEEESLKKDTSLDLSEIHMDAVHSITPNDNILLVVKQANDHIKLYVDKYKNGITSLITGLETGNTGISPTGFKIQKTRPSEGYHLWHCENASPMFKTRCISFILYLNDIEQGGETEFLYLSKRVQPKAGRLLIFPAGFTHCHRGNPPLSGDKYIATGWMEYV
jgi:hypothetical protein